ncbi:hypothetical protein [Actinokineospora sp. HUAS TT18]|uniref:hypothetical protein n=1 Tax=Actinokineospora sp. HUAS TT18 TaxID=3447451 RepID=UPI003F51DA81
MTSQTGTSSPIDQALPATDRIGWSEVPGRLRIALVAAAAGAALLVIGPARGLVADAPAAGFDASALLLVLAVLPVVLAVAFVVAGKAATGAGVLVGSALLTPGRALVDAQLAVDPLLASRPEFLVPTSLAPLTAAPGLWLLLGGHAAVALAGALALGRAGAVPGSPYAAEFDDHSDDRSTKARGTSLVLALLAGLVAGVALLLAPFHSDNAFMLARSVLEVPSLPRYGVLVLAAATVAAAVFAGGSARPSVARGVLLGATAALAAVVLPQLAAGFSVPALSVAPGPALALVAMALLTVAVWFLNRGETTERVAPSALLDAPEPSRHHLVAGLLGLGAAAAAITAASTAQLKVSAGLEAPVGYSARLFLPAAILLLLFTVPLLIPRVAASIRPAFAAATLAVPLAGAGALDAAFTATGVSQDIAVGPGVWFGVLAVALALAAGATAALAGVVERDDVDLTRRQVNLGLAAPLAVAALLAIGAFGLPVIKAPGLVAAGVWSNFRLTSWGLLSGLLLVLAAVVIAAMSRPPRAGALLLGAAGVVAVHALDYPLTADRAAASVPGPGLWLSVGCVAALLVSALVAVVSSDRR